MIDIDAESEQDTKKVYRRYRGELDAAIKDQADWRDRARKVIKRYRDDRSQGAESSKCNILWSIVQTITPAVYARAPSAQVKRRYNDQDPIGRLACTILERALDFESEHYGDLNVAIRGALQDRLLPGRGIAWVRYEPTIERILPPEIQQAYAMAGQELPDDEQIEGTLGAEAEEKITDERTCVDYVYWEDFIHSVARAEDEITWKARRVYLTRDELKERFGDELGAKIPLDYKMTGANGLKLSQAESMEKAEIYEIWSKTDKKVYWLSKSYTDLLDCRDDPLELEKFWPCPDALLSTTTTGSLIPIPDFCQYQDQADELDSITNRLNLLTKACKVVGVYPAESKELARVLTEGIDNQMIPVENWAMWAERGGTGGMLDWVPIDQVVGAIAQLTARKQQLVQEIYEITGQSDIMRGVTDPNETKGAQEIKVTYGQLRVNEIRRSIANFSSQIIRIKAQIMCQHYQPETLIKISGIDQTDDGRDHQAVAAAMQLLKNAPSKAFRIQVDAESLVQVDESAAQATAVQFVTEIGGFVNAAMQGAQAAPELAPLLGKILLYAVRSFPQGRDLEIDFEQALEQVSQAHASRPPQPTPAQIKQETERMKQQAQLQADQAAQAARVQADQAIESARAQATIEIEKAKLEYRAQADANKVNYDAQLSQYKAMQEQQTAIIIAKINALAKIEAAEVSSGIQAPLPLIDESTIANMGQ